MWCYYVIALGIFHGSQGNAINTILQSSEDDIYTEKFISAVKSAFVELKSLVLMQDDSYDDHIIDNLIGEHPFYSIKLSPDGVKRFNGIYDMNYSDEVTFEESKVYIYQVHEDQGFLQAMTNMRNIYFWRRRDKLLIIIKENQNHTLMIETFAKFRIINVVFIYPNGSVFTSDLIKNETFKEITNNKYYYDKMADLQGFPVRISMFKHNRDAIPNKSGYLGRDGLLAEAFMTFVNAKGIYIKPTDGITYGENRGNNNITGVFADIANNITDVALNSRLMKPEFENVVEYSYPHDSDDLIFIVPCGNADAVFEYYKSFQGVVWICVLTFNLFALIVFIKTNTFEDVSSATLHTFGIFFSQAYSKAKTPIARVLVLLFTVYTFLVVVHYGSLLYSIITVPKKPKEIDTFEDLAESKLNMYTVERYKRYLIEYGDASIRRLKDRIIIASEKGVNDLIDAHGNYAIIGKRSVADWAILQRKNYRNGKMIHRIMKKVPFPAIVCFIVKYGSPLKSTLNQFMQRIVESGIQNYWISSTLFQIFGKENKYYHDSLNPEKKIALNQLFPVFILYGVGITLSIIAFIAEMFYIKCYKRVISVPLHSFNL